MFRTAAVRASVLLITGLVLVLLCSLGVDGQQATTSTSTAGNTTAAPVPQPQPAAPFPVQMEVGTEKKVPGMTFDKGSVVGTEGGAVNLETAETIKALKQGTVKFNATLNGAGVAVTVTIVKIKPFISQ